MLSKVRRLHNFSTVELFILFQLIALAVAARLALTFLRLTRLMEFVAWGANNRFLPRLPLLQNRLEITRLMRLADIAARHTRPVGPCLLRSLLLLWLLKACGEQAALLIGVSKEASELSSHAWVEFNGRVLLDSAEAIGRFAIVLRI